MAQIGPSNGVQCDYIVPVGIVAAVVVVAVIEPAASVYVFDVCMCICVYIYIYTYISYIIYLCVW